MHPQSRTKIVYFLPPKHFPFYVTANFNPYIKLQRNNWNFPTKRNVKYQMPVARLTLEIAIEHAQSLKDRRQAIRSVKEKLRHSFNISIAELDEVTVWNRATLGIVAISSSPGYLAGQLQEVEAAARRLCTGLGCDLLDSFIEADVDLESSSFHERSMPESSNPQPFQNKPSLRHLAES